jgi:hypothetical protein
LATFQILLKLIKLLLLLAIPLGSAYAIGQVYQTELAREIRARESHDLCHDTNTQTAWVAYRNGEARCFLEYKEFPHKVKAAYLDENT